MLHRHAVFIEVDVILNIFNTSRQESAGVRNRQATAHPEAARFTEIVIPDEVI